MYEFVDGELEDFSHATNDQPICCQSFNTEAGCPALRANQPYPKTVTKMLEYGSRLGFQKGFKH
jgi:hypothetical protein